MVSISKFHRIIIFSLFVCFICVCVGSIDVIRSQTIGVTNNTNRTLLFGFTFCLMAFLLVWKCFYWLDNLSVRGCALFSVIVFILMAGIMVAISFCARVMQFSDAYDVMDTALFLKDNAEVSADLPYIKYVGSFGNNYPVILFQEVLLKILSWLNVQNCEIFLTHLNILFILSAVVLTWLIVKETRGVRIAAKTGFVCLLNPYFYLIVNWTYSMTFSLPIMMGILYFALLLKKTKKTINGVFFSLIEGLLVGIGFLIRPTTVFPLIAAVIVWLPFTIRRKISKQFVIQCICLLFVLVLVFSIGNAKVNSRFGSIQHLNMPLSFWLLMGSHENGVWNESDLNKMMTLQDSADKSQFGFDQTIKNYTNMGIDGTINHWYKKLITAWADGGFFYRSAPTSEGNSLSEYILGNGARNQLAMIYSQAFRLMMIIGFILACFIALLKRNMPEIVLIMIITIFGCVAFHSIWETNGRYSIPFILPMLVVVEYGISSLQAYSMNKVSLNKSQKHILGMALMGFLLIVCSNLNSVLKEKTTLNFYRVSSTINTRVCAPIEPQGFLQLDQDFYAEKPYNTLFLKATLPTQESKDEYSTYDLSILNDEEQMLFSTLITAEMISGQGIKVPFETISGSNHYHIRLMKKEPEEKSIQLYTHYTYAVDDYKGVLSTDDGKVYSNDLMMDIYEAKDTSLYSDKVRVTILLMILLTGSIICFIPVKGKK